MDFQKILKYSAVLMTFPVVLSLFGPSCGKTEDTLSVDPPEILFADAGCPGNARTFLSSVPKEEEIISFRRLIIPLFQIALIKGAPPCVVCHNAGLNKVPGNLALGGGEISDREVFDQLTEGSAEDPLLGETEVGEKSTDRSLGRELRIDCNQPEQSLLILEPTVGRNFSHIHHPSLGKTFLGPNDHAVDRIRRWIEQGSMFN